MSTDLFIEIVPDQKRAPLNITPAALILDFLNLKTGRKYRPVAVNLAMIEARLTEGATVEECRQVIAAKVRLWKNDPVMGQYLRPATLFNRTKFAQYVGEIGSTK